MKKGLLLIALPALMVLSACSGSFAAKEEPIQPEEIKEMIEDTTAHEEIFGGAAEPRLLGPRSLIEPSVDFSNVQFGVQYKFNENGDGVADDTVSIRYFAAITSANVTAEWHRGFARGTGEVPSGKGFDSDPLYSSKYYVTVNDGGTPITGGVDPWEDYVGFVVYTLSDISYETYKDSYLAVYLTLKDNNNPTENTYTTQVRAVRIEQIFSDHDSNPETPDICYSQNEFDFNKDAINGFFIEGRIDGKNDTIVEADDPVSDSEKYFASYSDLNIDDGDYFGSFLFDGSSFKYFGCDVYGEGCRGFLKESSNVGGFYSPYASSERTIATDGQYNLFLKKETGKYWHIAVEKSVEPTTYHLYLKPNGHWTGDNAWFQVYAFGTETDWYPMSQIGSTGIYEVESRFYSRIDKHDTIIFCRMNPNTGAVDKNWYDPGGHGVWNQTDNISLSLFTSKEGPNAVCNITSSGDNNYNYISY